MILVLSIVTIPIFALLLKAFYGPGESWSHLVKTVLATYTLNSIYLVIGVSILTLLFGVSSAWVVSRYHFFGKKVFEWLLILPLLIPSYITAYAYAGVFDYGGPVMTIFEFSGFDNFKIDIMNRLGLVFILAISLYPYVYVASRATFMYQSARLIEASDNLGANKLKTLFKVIIPLARPAIIGGLLLVIMEVLNDYGAAKYFGVNTLTTGVFRAWFALEEPNTAVFLSIILLLIVFVFVILERWQRGNKSYQILTKSDIRLRAITVSRRKNYVLMSIVIIPIVLGFIIPVIQLLSWLFITWEKTLSAAYVTIAMQSIGISLVAALLVVVCCLLLLYFSKWNRLKFLKSSTNIATLGYVIPGAVMCMYSTRLLQSYRASE